MLVPADYRASAALKTQSQLTWGLASDSDNMGFNFISCYLLCFCPAASSSPSVRVCHAELEVCGGSMFERGETLT